MRHSTRDKCHSYTWGPHSRKENKEPGLESQYDLLLVLRRIKFYWNTDKSICLPVVCGCFHAEMSELSNCSRDYVANKAATILYLAL